MCVYIYCYCYVSMHLEALQEKDSRCRQNQTLLWKLHVEQFTQWVKDKVYVAVDMEFSLLTFIVFRTNTILSLLSTDLF